MKVVIVMQRLSTGGIQKINLDIASKIKDPEITLLSLYPRQNSIFEEEADKLGIKVKYLNKKPGADLSIILQIYRFFKEYKPDVIHINQRMTVYVMIPAILCGIKKRMYVVHNMADVDAKGFLQKVNKFAFHHFHVLPVAISHTCRKSLSEVYGYPEDRIPIIYNGVDMKKFKRSSPYEAGDECVFVTACTFRKIKNMPLLVRAFKRVHNECPNTKLYIVGDGEDMENVKNEIKRLDLKDSVILPGASMDVPSWLNKADVYVCSSDAEGLPVSVIEAMMCSLPVITTKAGGVVDVVEEGINGMIVDTGDEWALASAMKKLACRPPLRQRMSRESERLAPQYSIQACADNYADLYRSLK